MPAVAAGPFPSVARCRADARNTVGRAAAMQQLGHTRTRRGFYFPTSTTLHLNLHVERVTKLPLKKIVFILFLLPGTSQLYVLKVQYQAGAALRGGRRRASTFLTCIIHHRDLNQNDAWRVVAAVEPSKDG